MRKTFALALSQVSMDLDRMGLPRERLASLCSVKVIDSVLATWLISGGVGILP